MAATFALVVFGINERRDSAVIEKDAPLRSVSLNKVLTYFVKVKGSVNGIDIFSYNTAAELMMEGRSPAVSGLPFTHRAADEKKFRRSSLAPLRASSFVNLVRADD
jgi:hypothetical protein